MQLAVEFTRGITALKIPVNYQDPSCLECFELHTEELYTKLYCYNTHLGLSLIVQTFLLGAARKKACPLRKFNSSVALKLL